MTDRNSFREEQRTNTRKLLETFGVSTDHVLIDNASANLEESEGRLRIEVGYLFEFDDMTEEQVKKVREVFGVQVAPVWKFSS